VDRAREYLPLPAVLRFLRVSPSRFHAGGASARVPEISRPVPAYRRLTAPTGPAIKDMMPRPTRHVPTGRRGPSPSDRHGLGLASHVVCLVHWARLAPPVACIRRTQDRAAD
jgi:hypothetical protein